MNTLQLKQISTVSHQDKCPIFAELKNCLDCSNTCPSCNETPVYALDGCIIESMIKTKKVVITLNHDNSQAVHFMWTLAAFKTQSVIEWGPEKLMFWANQDTFEVIIRCSMYI